MISPFDAPDNNPNVTYINHGLPHGPQNHNMFEVRYDMSLLMDLFVKELPALAKKFYDVPSVREIYNKRKQFDLIIFDWLFNEVSSFTILHSISIPNKKVEKIEYFEFIFDGIVFQRRFVVTFNYFIILDADNFQLCRQFFHLQLAYPFAHEQSFIMITTSGIEPSHSAIQGNILNPAYVSSSSKDYQQPLSFIERICNIFFHTQMPAMWNFQLVPRIQEEVCGYL